MAKFLYGGQFYRIQELIFATNKLSEIAGASEILEQLFSYENLSRIIPDFKENALLQNAAGNVRYLCTSKEEAIGVQKEIRKTVFKAFPGINFVDKVISLQNGSIGDGISQMIDALIQERNYPQKLPFVALLNAKRNSRTGGYTTHSVHGSWEEEITYLKDRAFKDESQSLLLEKIGYSKVEKEASNIASEASRSFIAVIHADGNSFGAKLKSFLNQDTEITPEKFHGFSNAISEATKEAIRKSIHSVYKEEIILNNAIPFRPIIVGGDDISIICSADDALIFGKEFLKNFEAETKEKLQPYLNDSEGLTSCMGIAFIKKNFPFHYGAALAEELCRVAKTASKKISRGKIPSSLAFYKVSQSFFDDFQDIHEKEMQLENGYSLFNGPYFLNHGDNTIEGLLHKLEVVYENNERLKNPPDAPMRKWLNLILTDDVLAKIQWQRIEKLHGKDFLKEADLKEPFSNGRTTTEIADLISLLSMNVKTSIES